MRGHQNESFYSYDFDKQNSKVLFCTVKEPLPNIFQCTSFKKHSAFLMSQNQENLKFPKIFMFLPSTLGRKESIQQYNDYVHLYPVDNSYDQLKSINNNKEFDPSHLDNSVLRKDVTKFFLHNHERNSWHLKSKFDQKFKRIYVKRRKNRSRKID